VVVGAAVVVVVVGAVVVVVVGATVVVVVVVVVVVDGGAVVVVGGAWATLAQPKPSLEFVTAVSVMLVGIIVADRVTESKLSPSMANTPSPSFREK